jgi:NADH-quinone oxidoreductase subunit J
MPLWLFAFLAAVAIVSALGVVVQRNPVHCLLALALTLTDLGALFVGLGAVTVGFLQIIIYVGAIMVLFLFVIWLLNLQTDPAPGGNLALKFLSVLGAAGLASLFLVLFARAAPSTGMVAPAAGYGSIQTLARMLFSDYLIAFEVTSILLFAAVVGAIGLARRGTAEVVSPARTEEAENIRSASTRRSAA